MSVTAALILACAQGCLLDPGVSVAQRQALHRVNSYRVGLGLPRLTWDDRLAKAAYGHTQYMITNKVIPTHVQDPGKPGYTGKGLGERLARVGVVASAYENVSGGGSKDGGQFIDGLFLLPYHRAPYLHPGLNKIGVGMELYDGTYVGTVDMIREDGKGTVVFPGPEQRNVPCSTNNNEIPDPLRMHRPRPAAFTTVNGTLVVEPEKVGTVISYNFFPTNTKLTFVSASLTLSTGELVPFWLNTPENDEYLKAAAFLTPKVPLSPQCKYNVALTIKDAAGKDISQAWSFTTGS
ncbi:MAG: CAP domain-containing protein [Armatimonadetes bacterium]|nr:CAP domain-containing protein [Armatimonadota bacterium]